MPVVSRPPSKGGNFFKAHMFKGDSVRVKVKNVRPDQQLPAGPATIVDFEYEGQPYGFPLNATNHKRLCALYGDPTALTFDTAKVIGQTITLKKVMAPNPKQGGTETESLRIA